MDGVKPGDEKGETVRYGVYELTSWNSERRV